jgi:hypothetical protein
VAQLAVHRPLDEGDVDYDLRALLVRPHARRPVSGSAVVERPFSHRMSKMW